MDGTPKPSAQAFCFPFVGLPTPGGKLTLWGRAPSPGVVVIQRENGHRWSALVRLTTTPGGIFYGQRRLGTHLVLRAQIGLATSLAWTNG